MHVHNQYNLPLASQAVGLNAEMREIAARKAAELRRRLASPLLSLEGEDEPRAGAVVYTDPNERKKNQNDGQADDAEFQRAFSAMA